MDEDIETKKYCIEQAVKCAGDHVAIAPGFFDFLMCKKEAGQAQEVKRGEVRRAWMPASLTRMQKIVLGEAVKKWSAGDKINGAEMDRHLKQTGSGDHLNALVKKGYMRRYGNKYTPIRDKVGAELPTIVQVLPPQPALGYKPMTAPTGQIARVRRG